MSEELSTELVYPEWIRERLTPDLEVTEVTKPEKVELWFHPRQNSDSLPTGNGVYEAHGDERLERTLSYGHLKWYEENPDQIPSEWKEEGYLVYGFASVVRGADVNRYAPNLLCYSSRPRVRWHYLTYRWRSNWPSGLLVS